MKSWIASACLVIAACTSHSGVAFEGTALAGAHFPAGTRELTVARAVSVRHRSSDLREVEGFHLLPHFGYFLTDEHGPGLLRGNLELLIEPEFSRLAHDESSSLWGVALFGRWVFTRGRQLYPYVEAGAGTLMGRPRLPESDCPVNFTLQSGVGVLIPVTRRTAITAGYRFHHISNGNVCGESDRNVGIDSSMLVIGLTYLFP